MSQATCDKNEMLSLVESKGRICWHHLIIEPAVKCHGYHVGNAQDILPTDETKEIEDLALSLIAAAAASANNGVVIVHFGCTNENHRPCADLKSKMEETVQTFIFAGRRCMLYFDDCA